jgi:hypothetical protein
MGESVKLWAFENARNETNAALFKEMLLLAYPDTELVVAGHHIFHRRRGAAHHEEIPSADTLIFDHTIAKAVWGDRYMAALEMLALCPVERRDVLLQHLFDTRTK